MGYPEMIRLTRTEADTLAAQLPSYDRDRYDWERRLRIVTANVESDLRAWRGERDRMNGLIENWSPKPLRTIEEEIQHQEQTRAERERARTVARDEKISAEVVKIRKRIDSAVRNRNSSVLADIYVSDKLRDMSGYRLSKDQARDLLERNNVWRAFGLMTPSGSYVPEEAARETLDDMTWGLKVPAPPDSGLRYMRVPLPWPAELGGGFSKMRR